MYMRMCRDLKSHGETPPARQAAFTVTELLVAVSLMTLIVLALFSMFNQTQKAMRSNEAQVDSTERGRAVLEIVAREIEDARVSMRPTVTNFYVRMAPSSRVVQDDTQTASAPQATDTPPRTNLFDQVYFLAKIDRAWRGMGFSVMVRTNIGVDAQKMPGPEALAPAQSGVGTLYRYESRVADREYQQPTTNLFKRFLDLMPSIQVVPAQWPASTNFSQVADGIVHFRALPYDTDGKLLNFWNTNLDSHYKILRVNASGLVLPTVDKAPPGYGASNVPGDLGQIANVILKQEITSELRGETSASFRSNALPAYVELELGVLEPDTLRQYNQMVKDGQPVQAQRYLERRMAKVQIFRKRIPLKTVAQ